MSNPPLRPRSFRQQGNPVRSRGVLGHFPAFRFLLQVDVGHQCPIFSLVFPKQDYRFFARCNDGTREAAIAERLIDNVLDLLVVLNDWDAG